MIIWQAWYFVTIIIFGGSAVALDLILFYEEIRPYFRLMVILVLIALALTPILEPPAIQTQAWVYNAQYMLNTHPFSAELETYLFTAMVGIAIGSVTLVFASIEEKGLCSGNS